MCSKSNEWFSNAVVDRYRWHFDVVYRHIWQVRMDAINRTLLISLKQEVKTLNEIVNELPAVNCREEVRSWLFPSKPYQFVNEYIYGDDILELDNFKSYLELIIDR